MQRFMRRDAEAIALNRDVETDQPQFAPQIDAKIHWPFLRPTIMFGERRPQHRPFVRVARNGVDGKSQIGEDASGEYMVLVRWMFARGPPSQPRHLAGDEKVR
jgi:hypothetical protein